MNTEFLIYSCNGFEGEAITSLEASLFFSLLLRDEKRSRASTHRKQRLPGLPKPRWLPFEVC